MKSFGALTFHTKIKQQVHKMGFDINHSNPKFSPILSWWDDRFLNFQIWKTVTGESIIEILLINYDSGEEIALTSDAGFTAMKAGITEYEAPTPFEVIIYDGDTLDETLVNGFYYLKITLVADTEEFFSDVFLIEIE